MRARALDGAEARITALEERMDEVERQIAQLAGAVTDFSNAVDNGLANQEKHLAALSGKLTEMRCLVDVVHRGEVIDLPASPQLIRKVN